MRIGIGLYTARSDDCIHLMVESTNLREENMLQAICGRSFPLISFEALFYLFIYFISFILNCSHEETY